MIPADIIQRVRRAHDAAVDAACKWSYAAGANRSTERLHDRYQKAEQKFEAAMAALVDAAN